MLAEGDKTFYYSYGRFFSNGFLVIFSSMSFLGLYGFLHFLSSNVALSLLGLLVFLGGILSYLPIELLQVNFENKKYRVGYKFFSKIQESEWKSLSAVQYISIVVKKESILSNKFRGQKDYVEDYQLRFFVKAGYYSEIDTFRKKDSAIYIGSLIAEGLNLPLLDATIQPAEFVTKEV